MRTDGPLTRRDASTPPLGPTPTAVGTALLVGIVAAIPIVASFPAASAGFLAGALVARRGRPLVRRLRNRIADRTLGPLCVPGTDVCVGA